MAFTFGFYNSSNHDRMYDAEEFSRIFDGLITDGVYATIGNRFVVRTANEDNTIIVGSGRAWFNHSWSYNDTDMQLTGPASNVLFNRWDAIVLDVNSEIAYRTNSIIWVTGDATSSPVKPTMIHTNQHHQYPLAYIYRPANNNAIPAINITSCIGLDECPYTQGLITDTKNIAPVENNDFATRAYKIGEYILWKNEFYKVTTAIAKNARIIPKPTSGYNITRSTIAEELYTTFTMDTVPTSGHTGSAVTSDGIYRALGNRSIIQTSSPALNGNDLITNGQVYAALGNRSNIETSPPASGSNNLITAGQVYTAFGNRSSISIAVSRLPYTIICPVYYTASPSVALDECRDTFFYTAVDACVIAGTNNRPPVNMSDILKRMLSCTAIAIICDSGDIQRTYRTNIVNASLTQSQISVLTSTNYGVVDGDFYVDNYAIIPTNIENNGATICVLGMPKYHIFPQQTTTGGTYYPAEFFVCLRLSNIIYMNE